MPRYVYLTLPSDKDFFDHVMEVVIEHDIDLNAIERASTSMRKLNQITQKEIWYAEELDYWNKFVEDLSKSKFLNQ